MTTPVATGAWPGVTLDRSAVDAFREASPDSPDFVNALIDQYLQEAASHVATIADAARCFDRPRLKATAHSLKGSSLVMGALQLAALCAQLEDQAAQLSDAIVAFEMTGAIDRELVRVRDAFASECHS